MPILDTWLLYFIYLDGIYVKRKKCNSKLKLIILNYLLKFIFNNLFYHKY